MQAVEAARTFEEGVVTDVREADVGSILGFGFAPFSGGTLSYIDMMGTKRFVELCRRLEKKYGPRFAPPKLLLDMAEKGESFYGRFAPGGRRRRSSAPRRVSFDAFLRGAPRYPSKRAWPDARTISPIRLNLSRSHSGHTAASRRAALERLEWLANIMDTAIVLPGNIRIGADAVIGLAARHRRRHHHRHLALDRQGSACARRAQAHPRRAWSAMLRSMR